MKRKALARFGSALIATTALMVVALPAQANSQWVETGGCRGLAQNSVTQNQAWSWDYNEGCGVVGVKHEYNYCSGSPGIPCWGPWAYETTGLGAASTVKATITRSQHRFYVFGTATYFNMTAT